MIFRKNNIENSNVVPHRSTTSTRSCLTSMSRRVSVFSWLYGRSCCKWPYLYIWRLKLLFPYNLPSSSFQILSETMTPYRASPHHSSFINHAMLLSSAHYSTITFNIHHCSYFMLINTPNRHTYRYRIYRKLREVLYCTIAAWVCPFFSLFDT